MNNPFMQENKLTNICEEKNLPLATSVASDIILIILEFYCVKIVIMKFMVRNYWIIRWGSYPQTPALR